MWRALAVFVTLLMAAGIWAILADPGMARAAATPSPSSGDFGFALAAGAVALAATMMVARPRMRWRR